MADSPPYTWLLSVLVLWLLAVVARQVFDLIGKLWIPVAFNLLQVVCLMVTSVISIMYNIVLLLWFTGVFGDFSRPLLSAGLPYSHSSGFMNSSYEDGQDRDAYSEPKTVRPEGGYIRQSARKHRVKSSHLVGFLKAAENFRPDISNPDLSSRERSPRNGTNKEQLYNFKTDFLGDDWNEYEDPYSRPRVRSGSVRSFKMPTTQNVRRMLSHEHLATNCLVDERGSRQRSSINNLTSLVSFDPKSNTLIRVREHIGDQSDDEYDDKPIDLSEKSFPSDVRISNNHNII
ncbi:unnamed protein product [Enterobius vermicularis]|uniref:Bestrophin homolog n=1 Tax=Enterobius vermicularis TaxID=51028 RepID=A0A0N4V2B8_ENTVE|nr:unnamed protein product [Enterobius vermicularis]